MASIRSIGNSRDFTIPACQRRTKTRCRDCGRRYVTLTSSLFQRKKKKKDGGSCWGSGKKNSCITVLWLRWLGQTEAANLREKWQHPASTDCLEGIQSWLNIQTLKFIHCEGNFDSTAIKTSYFRLTCTERGIFTEFSTWWGKLNLFLIDASVFWVFNR